jgi:hypothetical protein
MTHHMSRWENSCGKPCRARTHSTVRSLTASLAPRWFAPACHRTGFIAGFEAHDEEGSKWVCQFIVSLSGELFYIIKGTQTTSHVSLPKQGNGGGREERLKGVTQQSGV